MEIADAFRKVLNPDQSVAHRRCPDHRILELSNVSRPRIILQLFERCRRETNIWSERVDAIRKRLRQRWNVIAAIAQGRQRDRYGVQPVVHIFAESSSFHLSFDIAIAGGDYSDIDSLHLV